MNKPSYVSYKKLFKLLIDRDEKKTIFANKAGINSNTLAKLSKNEYVSMEVIVRICHYLQCSVEEIMEIIPEEK